MLSFLLRQHICAESDLLSIRVGVITEMHAAQHSHCQLNLPDTHTHTQPHPPQHTHTHPAHHTHARAHAQHHHTTTHAHTRMHAHTHDTHTPRQMCSDALY